MHYEYVGPKEILDDVADAPIGELILCQQDILKWYSANLSQMNDEKEIVATYTVGLDGKLRVASRNSEHVACSGRQPVLTAGELTILHDGTVENIKNQSTGFCPSENSWPAIAQALDYASIERPTGFSNTIIFRKCLNCKENNLVKDNWFVCVFCDADLPLEWNFDSFYKA